MYMIQLTTTDGREVYVNQDAIITVAAPGTTEHEDTGAVVTLPDGKRIGVQETVEAVLQKLKP